MISFASAAPPSTFVGYETLRAETAVRRRRGAARERLARVGLVKLEESPFYPEGGGQVADSGLIRWDGAEARVADVYRVGDDQVIRLDGPAPEPGGAGRGRGRRTRPATPRCETTPPPTCSTRRFASGSAPTSARPARRCAPTSCASTSPTARRSPRDELREVEDRVNDWIKASRPVRAMQMERGEAEALGAMALFGEKYGDWVRVIEVDDVSRELCGGTHVANTAEIGIFAIVSEGSSAANVRRIEALTGPGRDRLVPGAKRRARRGRGAARVAPRPARGGPARRRAAGRARAGQAERMPRQARRAGGPARRRGRGDRRGPGRGQPGAGRRSAQPCSTSPIASRRGWATRRS